MRVYQAKDPKPVFCGPACRSGFKEDRAHGLAYGPNVMSLESGENVLCHDRETWSQETGCCAYCGEETKG